MNSICNRAIVLSLLGSFGMLVGVSSEAGSLDSRQEVVSEMKCVKRILQHNIGGQEGYAFSKESIKKAIPLFHSKQTMSGVIQECAGFLKTHSDTG